MKLRDLAYHLHAALAEASAAHPQNGQAQWEHVAGKAVAIMRGSAAVDTGDLADAAGVELTDDGSAPPIPPSADDPAVQARVLEHERNLRARLDAEAKARAANAAAIAANPDTVTLDGEPVPALDLGEIAAAGEGGGA